MLEVLIVAGVAVAALAWIAWSGARMLRSGEGSTGTADAFGGLIDVFDPAQGRASRDLEAQKHQGAVIPSPDDDEPSMTIDLKAGRARVRPPDQPPA